MQFLEYHLKDLGPGVHYGVYYPDDDTLGLRPDLTVDDARETQDNLFAFYPDAYVVKVVFERVTD